MLLTNGIVWRAHRLRFEQPIQNEEVFSIDLLDPAAKPAQLIERLYLISREGVSATAIDSFWHRKEATSRYVIGQLLLTPEVLTAIRRHLRRQYPELKISDEEIAGVLQAEVMKRDVLEGERADTARKPVRRAARKREREKAGDGSAAAVLAVAEVQTPPVVVS